MKKLAFGIVMVLMCCCFATSVFATSEAPPNEPADWAKYEVLAANAVDILPTNAFTRSFYDNITREEFCEIIVRTYEKIEGKEIALPRSSPFKDTTNPYILKAAAQKIVDGFEDGTFRPEALLTRQEAAKMIHGALFADSPSYYFRSKSDSLYFEDTESIADWAALSVYILHSNGIMKGSDNYEILPLANLSRQEAIALAVRSLGNIDGALLDNAGYYLSAAPGTGYEMYSMFREDSSIYLYAGESYADNCSLLCQFFAPDSALIYETTLPVDSYRSAHLTVGNYKTVWSEEGRQRYDAEGAIFDIIYGEGSGPKTVYLKVTQISPKGNPSPNTCSMQISLKPYINENDMITGDPDRGTFTSDAEARAFMTTITVNVWNIDNNGNKVPSTRSFTLHRAFADDMWNAFQEIFNDPEQFPIKSIGGYDWRGGSRTEHNTGTAIDINPNENAFYDRNGNLLSGSFFLPGENPYSIPLEGSVVRILAKYGWTRGFWNSGTDYMHFSYFGT